MITVLLGILGTVILGFLKLSHLTSMQSSYWVWLPLLTAIGFELMLCAFGYFDEKNEK